MANCTTLSKQQIEQYASQAGFTGQALNIITAIAQAESLGNTCAENLSDPHGGSFGLVQINGIHIKDASPESVPEITFLCAYDPLCAMQFAYKLSNHGTKWTDWGTYTNGKYKNYLTSPAPAQLTQPEWVKPFMSKSVATIEATFNHYPTSSEGWVEGGVDWSPPAGTPITALLPGQVVGAGYFCKNPANFCASSIETCGGSVISYGVVTIRSKNPYQNIVPGSMIDIYYQHILIDPSIKIPVCNGSSNQFVNAGQVIGAVNPRFNIEVGINVSQDGWGTIWGLKSSSVGPHVDPIPYLYNLIQSGGGAYSGTGGNFSSSSTNPFVATASFIRNSVMLSPDASVIGFLAAIDDVLSLRNPFVMDSQQEAAIQDELNIPVIGTVSFSDPVKYIEDVTLNMARDLGAAIFRLMFITLGIFICFKVFGSFLGLDEKLQRAEQGLGTIAKILPLLVA